MYTSVEVSEIKTNEFPVQVYVGEKNWMLEVKRK